MAQHHVALVSVKVHSPQASSLMRQVFKESFKQDEVLQISSVYKVFEETARPSHIHDLKTYATTYGLCLVAKVSIIRGPQELVDDLQGLQEAWTDPSTRRGVSLNLLVFEDQVSMTPHLTLPHPELHLKAHLLIPSAEIWGQYQHPIIGQSLSELSQWWANKTWGEFHAPGKSLLDF